MRRIEERRQKKRREKVHNYKSAWWSETLGPLTLISPLPSILSLHFQHRVISYSSQSWVWCQRAAKFRLCFWLKIFQWLWGLIGAMLMGDEAHLKIHVRVWPAEVFAIFRALSMAAGLRLNDKGEMALIQVSFSVCLWARSLHIEWGSCISKAAHRVVLCMQPRRLIKARLTSEGSSALGVILPEWHWLISLPPFCSAWH